MIASKNHAEWKEPLWSSFCSQTVTVALMLECTVASVRLSSVCKVCTVSKRCVLPKNCLKKQIGNGLWGIEWSCDR